MTLEPKVISRGFSTSHLSKRDYIAIAFGVCSWLAVIFAAIFAQNQKELALACVFAPVGALMRWYLSFYNGNWTYFPVGTYIANVFGTAVIAVLALLQNGVHIVPIACQVLQGLQDGFCGCLTTISTFMVELSTLPRRSSYIYGFISVVVAQCFVFVIYGTYIWSQGVHPTCTR